MTTVADFQSTYTPVSGPLGSQAGGVYEHNETGRRFYIKFSQTPDHARNEVLASRLYALAGVSAVQTRRVEHNGRLATASPWIDGAQQDLMRAVFRPVDTAYLAKIRRGFAVDAWLANWDVAGLGYDNIVSDANDNPVRVDTGGCLMFRAMGAPKGRLFGPVVYEWDTLRNEDSAPQASRLFAGMSREELLVSALNVAGISERQIAETVASVGFDALTTAKLTSALIARREDILNQALEV